MGSGASSRAEIDDDDVTALADLGAAMRARRTQLGLTLSKLSDATGLSVPFLSQVETSFAAPSLISLFSIARALNTTPERLLAGPVSASVVVTASDQGPRYPVTDASDSATRRQLTGLGEPFSAAEYEVPAGADLGGFFSSDGREMIHVKVGRLAVDLEESESTVVTRELAAGDTIIYSTPVRHRWRHLGRSTTRFVHVSVAET